MESGAVQFQDLFEIMDTWQTTGVRLQDVVRSTRRIRDICFHMCVRFFRLSVHPPSLSLSLFRTGFIPLSGGVCVYVCTP